MPFIHWLVFIISILQPAPAHVDTVSFPTFIIYDREVRVQVRVKAEYFSEFYTKNSPDEIGAVITHSIHIDANGHALAASESTIQYTHEYTHTHSSPSEIAPREPPSQDILLNCHFVSNEPIDHIKIRYDLLSGHDPRHKGFGKIKCGIQEKVFIFRINNNFESSIQDIGPTSVSRAALAFFLLGMDHILSGYDHLLFLLGLLLAARTIKNLAAVVTGFTLGHSVTLAAAALQWFSLPAGIVEPAIAASVAFVGIENIIRKHDSSKRWLLALLFGLIHGLGFAGFLEEAELPADATIVCLASFNIGVEAGQASIVCLLFPLLAWLREKNEIKFRYFIFRPASLAIALAGFVWFVARVV